MTRRSVAFADGELTVEPYETISPRNLVCTKCLKFTIDGVTGEGETHLSRADIRKLYMWLGDWLGET